jgi:hypothetical protein
MKWKVLCALLVTYIVVFVLIRMIPFCDDHKYILRVEYTFWYYCRRWFRLKSSWCLQERNPYVSEMFLCVGNRG